MSEPKPEDPAKAFTEADAKKRCGLCGYKAEGKGNWTCTNLLIGGTGTLLRFPACAGFAQKPSVQRKLQPKKIGLPVPPGVKFIYLGRPMRLIPGQPVGSRDHQGVVTVAWLLMDPDTLHLGFSFCNPGQKGVPPGADSGGKIRVVGRPAVPPDSFCKVEGRDIAMKNLYDDPLVYRFLYNRKRAICDVVKAVLSHDKRLRQFASVPPLLKAPEWTRDLIKPKPRVNVIGIGRMFHGNDALSYLLYGRRA